MTGVFAFYFDNRFEYTTHHFNHYLSIAKRDLRLIIFAISGFMPGSVTSGGG